MLREDLVDVMQLEGFRDIRHSTLLTIVQQENLLISESSLVLGAMMWAHTECNRQDIKPTPRAMRQMLGPAFTEFRFLAMSAEEFSKNFILTTLLSTTEKIAILANVSKADEIKLPDIFSKIEYPRSLPITPKPIVKFGYEVNNCNKNAFDVTKTKKLQCCNTFEVSYDILLTGFVFPTGTIKRKGEEKACKAQITVVLQDKDFKLIETIRLDEEVAVGTSLCPRYHPPIIISKNCTYRISAVVQSPGHYEKWAGNDFTENLRVFTKINTAANPEPCFIKAIRYLKL